MTDSRTSAVGVALVVAVTAGAGLVMVGAGLWGLAWPEDFAESVKFTGHTHFVHDAGAFQIGLGAGLFLALLWRDALVTTLTGFLVANTVHAYNHAQDLDLGGRDADPWLLGVLSVLVAAALVLRLRALGWVVGLVRFASTPVLAPFVEQKTVALTTYRADGSPVSTPVSLAVDGDRAVVRTYDKAGKMRRLRANSWECEVAPSTARGTRTAPAIHATARLLNGGEARDAARLLRRKYPLLHGVLVPLLHRVRRTRTGPTVHLELTTTENGRRTP